MAIREELYTHSRIYQCYLFISHNIGTSYYIYVEMAYYNIIYLDIVEGNIFILFLVLQRQYTLTYCLKLKYNENGCAINSNFISTNVYKTAGRVLRKSVWVLSVHTHTTVVHIYIVLTICICMCVYVMCIQVIIFTPPHINNGFLFFFIIIYYN